MTFALRTKEAADSRTSRFRRLADAAAVVAAPSRLVSITVASITALAFAATPVFAHASRHHKALIRVSTAKLRSSPDSSSKTAALLDEGRDARVVGRKGDWVRLRLDSGREGWVRHDLVEIDHNASRDSDNDSDSDSSSHHSSRRHHATEIAAASSSSHHHSRHLKQVAEIADQSARSSRHHLDHAGRKTVQIASIAVKAAHSREIRESSPIEKTEIADVTGDASTTDETAQYTPDNSSPRAERLVNHALAYRGTPYRMGATGNGAFDCSGFTQYLFSSEGTSLPRTASEQYAHAKPVLKSDLQPGDLVFFQNTYKRGVSHVGIYIGNGSFVHASSGRGAGVTVTRLSDAYYMNHWAGARRPR